MSESPLDCKLRKGTDHLLFTYVSPVLRIVPDIDNKCLKMFMGTLSLSLYL